MTYDSVRNGAEAFGRFGQSVAHRRGGVGRAERRGRAGEPGGHRAAAGVGIATLYRNFPSREALAAEIYQRETDELVRLAAALAGEADPAAALRSRLRAVIGFMAAKKGMAAALAMSARMPDALTTYSADRLTPAVERLVGRVTAGVPLPFVVRDALRMVVALCYEFEEEGWQVTVAALLDTFVAGLRGAADR